MNQIKLFIELTRLNKPIGYMLLFWPCSWGLTLAYDFYNLDLSLYVFYLILFFMGSILMRSAGCIINDIADRNFDKKILRTKNRPVASGKVSIIRALIYSIFLCFLALLILINFNKYTILLAFISMPLAFTYPLMKRYTYWPQLFLGITFNYGIILGWVSITNEINIITLILYCGGIFWTLGYDTIYGYQDIYYDEIIGLKSTSIKFKTNPYLFLHTCYILFFICLILLGNIMNFNMFYFFFLISSSTLFYILNLKNLSIINPESCLRVFKSNNFIGLSVFMSFLIGKI
jgi:4-hydroxybenzoate polyprenyltransferase